MIASLCFPGALFCNTVIVTTTPNRLHSVFRMSWWPCLAFCCSLHRMSPVILPSNAIPELTSKGWKGAAKGAY